ncbi:MAG: replication associated protein [Avonheates virus SG2_28]|nr:MAG: replication associated protein [Avonheates virus SG2_28]
MSQNTDLGSLVSFDLSIPSSFDPGTVVDDLTVDSDFSTIKGNNKIGKFILTAFPPDCDAKWLLPSTYFTDTSVVENWCGQFETATTTQELHLHLYIELVNSKRMRFNQLRKLFAEVIGKGCDISRNKRTSNHAQACSVNYVLAPSKRADGTEPFIWEHNKKKLSFDESLWKERTTKQAKPTKDETKQAILDLIESKPKHWTWEQIVHESIDSKFLLADCSWGAKFHAGRHAEVPRRVIKNIVVLYGAGGTGKSTMALNWDVREGEDKQERYYKRNFDDGKFWGGGRSAYKSQRIIHFEEFCGQETAANFKDICDPGKEGPEVNIKQSGTWLNHETVIITTNHHPASWYRKMCSNDPKQWASIARRFTHVLFYPTHRPDGSLNRPDAEHPEYYVDQTDELLATIDSYQDACLHAATHWPLAEADHFDEGEMCAPGFNPAKRQRLN